MPKKLASFTNPLQAVAKLFIKKPITYNFPPEMPISMKSRGRHIFDPKECIGCSLCAKICPNIAIEMVKREKDGKVILQPQLDYQKCCFCGLCVDYCPRNALQFTNFPMLVVMDKKHLIYSPEKLAEPPKPETTAKPKIQGINDWARSRSLWIMNYFTGCCFLEAIPWVSSGFDMERFGLIVANSPRHADVLLVGGYVTIKTVKRIIRVYQQMPLPKYVIALGNCPMSGGTYWDSYNTIKRIDDYIPIDIWIAGCPPRPEPIGHAIVEAIHAIQAGYSGKEEEVNLQKDFQVQMIEDEHEVGKEDFFVPFGPQHPASGNFHMGIRVEGESIAEAKVYPGYLHRGFEKLMEYRTWLQNIMLVQRICVLDGASYELAYVGAVEKLAGIQVPKKAKYLRTIQAELSRIQSHLLNLGLLCYSMGLDTMKMISWGDRERILKILDEMTGARIYNIYNTLGGVRNDLPPSFEKLVEEMTEFMRNRLEIYDELTFENITFIERTKNIGRITKEMTEEYDVTGPNLRASGTDFDIRKSVPYEAYEELDFKVPRFIEGDVYHRALCRRIEIEESLNLIEQALSKLPKGKIRESSIKDGTKVGPFNSIPEGESIHCVESARGELCFHMISDGSNKPYRAKIRGPTFDPILVLLPDLLKGKNIADAPVIYWSLDNCPADHDR